MEACPEYEERLTLHAADALEAEEEARVLAHLETCAGCRAEAASTARLLGRLAPPPLTLREQAVVATLPRRTQAAWRREWVRKAARMQWTGALMAAAAVVALVLVPTVRRGAEPRALTPVLAPVSADAADETLEAFDAWALRDPLADALDEDDAEEWEDALPFGAEDLEFNLGEPL
ncbi:zf-HC2 domain-containing protein [Myxococcaceae bacterium GXIMD 01537]